jgi:hypothetical protein
MLRFQGFPGGWGNPLDTALRRGRDVRVTPVLEPIDFAGVSIFGQASLEIALRDLT